MKINKFRLAVAILVLILVGFLIWNYNGKITAKLIEEQNQQKFYESWLPENCNCLERNLTKCSDGFELKGNLCKNSVEKTFTNVLKACSKYECQTEGTVYTFNQENKKWEIGNG